MASEMSGQGSIGEYEPRYLTEQHFSFIKRFYEEVITDQAPPTFAKMNKTIAKMPCELIKLWI